jgi:hypothetical protein
MSNQKIRLWSAVGVVALGFALVVGQGISGVAVQPSYADGTTTTNTTPPPTTPPPPTTVEKGNNGWGNGLDGENPGTDNGLGVSPGNGNGISQGGQQSETKPSEFGAR